MPKPNFNVDAEGLRVQFEAWIQGARARASDLCKLHECPYEERTLAGDAWENGWECIDFDLRMNRGLNEGY